MKKILFVGLLCVLSIPIVAEYYYYQGERVPLVVNPESVTIYTHTARSSLSSSFHSFTIAKNQVPQIASSNISSVEYIVGDTITYRMSNCFYIKLHESADTVILKEIIEETNTYLSGEVPYMNKWYKIIVDNSVINNSLEMSNYFYETGLFADVDPGFVFEFSSNCMNDSSRWKFDYSE